MQAMVTASGMADLQQHCHLHMSLMSKRES